MSDEQKRLVGRKAAEHVADGMVLGLGTGSTVRHFIDAVGEKVRDGMRLRGIPTSSQTRAQCESLGIPLVGWDEVETIDLTVDGADEVSRDYHMIKGGGGALLIEKIVAAASRRRIYIVDESKLVPQLGAFALPVEVVPFGWLPAKRVIQSLGAKVSLRQKDGQPFVTDSGNHILDCAFEKIENPRALQLRLLHIPAVVETGLFLDMVDVLIAMRGGEVVEIKSTEKAWW